MLNTEVAQTLLGEGAKKEREIQQPKDFRGEYRVCENIIGNLQIKHLFFLNPAYLKVYLCLFWEVGNALRCSELSGTLTDNLSY